MSTVKTKNVQVGTSVTPTDNFTIYQPTSPDGTLRIGNGNTGTTSSQVVLTSAGNVGIGTSAPNSKLTLVQGSEFYGFNIQANSSSESGSIRFTNSGFSAEQALIGSLNGGGLFITTATAERLRIDSSGNVGIGTSSPQSLLDLTGNDPTLRFTDNAGSPASTFSIRSTDATLRFRDVTNGADRMVVDASGNVGIGTSSPQTRLHTFSSATNTTLSIQGSLSSGANTPTLDFTGNNGGYSFGARIQAIRDTASGGYALAFGTTANNAAESSAPTERMRVNSSGNLLVGTTATDLSSPGFGVDVRSGVLNGVSIIKNNTSWGTALFIRRNTGAGTGSVAEFNYNGTTTGTISITTTTTAYNTSSDYRLKHDIQPMTGALEKVAQLNPVTYKWNADNSSGEGFIAHELQAVCPDAVTGEKDAVDENGNPQYQGVDTSFLVATLTAAIQELKAELDAAKARIELLEAQ